MSNAVSRASDRHTYMCLIIHLRGDTVINDLAVHRKVIQAGDIELEWKNSEELGGRRHLGRA